MPASYLFLTAFAVATASVPLLLRVAPRERFLDRARADRFSTRSVPRLGGPAVLSGVLAALALALTLALGPSETFGANAGVVVAGGALLAAAALGYFDDRGRLPAWAKGVLEALVLSGGFLLARALVMPADGSVPENGAGLFGLVGLRAWDLLWIVGACVLQVALNIYDNMDGAMVAGAFPGLCLFAFASEDAPPLALALAGALLGFFLWNRPPARVFLGNLGSRVVSLGVAWLVLTESVGESPRRALFAFVPFVMPAADLAFVVTRRMRSGRAPWTGGRDHTTHELSRALGSDRRALVVITLLSVAASFAAWIWRPR